MPVGAPSGVIASAPRSGQGFYTRTDGSRTQRVAAKDVNRAANGTVGHNNAAPAAGVRRAKTPVSARARGQDSATAINRMHVKQSSSFKLRTATPKRASASTPAAATLSRPAEGWRSRRKSRVTLILDLDETLVHSSFEPVKADLHIPVVLEGERYVAYVKKRPHVDQFLARCVQLFDVVIWTASLSVYAEPLIQQLCGSAKCGNIRQMYREACTSLPEGGYVKDLAVLGRSMDDVCILDNSPAVAQLQPDNLIPIVSWYDDPRDTCLRDLIPHLDRLAMGESVTEVIPSLPGVAPA